MGVLANGSGTFRFKRTPEEETHGSPFQARLTIHMDGIDAEFHGLTKTDIQELKNQCTDFLKRWKPTRKGAGS